MNENYIIITFFHSYIQLYHQSASGSLIAASYAYLYINCEPFLMSGLLGGTVLTTVMDHTTH